MKRIGMSILSLALLLCLAACGNTNPAASGTAAPETAVPETAAPQEDYGDELTDYDEPDGYGDEDDDGPPWDEEDDDGEEADK